MVWTIEKKKKKSPKRIYVSKSILLGNISMLCKQVKWGYGHRVNDMGVNAWQLVFDFCCNVFGTVAVVNKFHY